MKTTAICLSCALWWMQPSIAASQDIPLAEQDALALVALADEVRADSMQVVSIREGTVRCRDFEEPGVVRVTVLRLNSGREGQRVKTLVCRDFRWSEKYGWYLEKTSEGRFGTQVHIFSQTLGEVIIR